MNKIQGMLGLCRKAGKLATGYDMTVDAVKKGDAKLVLVAIDCSERTKRNIEADKAECELSVLPMTMDEIGFAVAKRAGILAVCDSGFAKKIKELLDMSIKE